jgi:signal transduction histidine kinase
MLTALNLGPVVLKERIASLGGSLVINSTKTGARLDITVPLARPEA